MKKTIKFVVFLSVLFAFSTSLKAVCNDEDLNEWATRAEVQFDEIKESGLNSSKYAYLLSVTPPRNDIRIVVTDEFGGSSEGKSYQKNSKESVYGVGCYNNLEEETYTMKIYGGKNSKCAGELLKTLSYTVPRYNRYIKDARCKDNDSELCQTYTNATKGMDSVEFDKALTEKINEEESNTTFNKIIKAILNYGLYILIPLVVVSIIYGIKINKYKKEERDR